MPKCDDVEYQYLYLIREENATDYVKIGRTTDIKKRMYGMKCSNHRNFELMGSIKHIKRLCDPEAWIHTQEKKLHKIFSHLRYKGEWFKYDESILSYFAERGDKLYRLTVHEDIQEALVRPPSKPMTGFKISREPDQD